jgi:hypothetical protein
MISNGLPNLYERKNRDFLARLFAPLCRQNHQLAGNAVFLLSDGWTGRILQNTTKAGQPIVTWDGFAVNNPEAAPPNEEKTGRRSTCPAIVQSVRTGGGFRQKGAMHRSNRRIEGPSSRPHTRSVGRSGRGHGAAQAACGDRPAARDRHGDSAAG